MELTGLSCASDHRHSAFSRSQFAIMIVLILASASLLPNISQADSLLQSFPPARQEQGQQVDHAIWDQLLHKYIVQRHGVNLVDYRAMKRDDHGTLKRYIALLAGTDPRRLGRSEQFAYWVNLYNALTVNVILNHYPVASIRKIRPSFFSSGPWDKKLVRVRGVALSLNDIEHKILRAGFKDRRVHFAVNCASFGCPNLANRAWRGATLNAMLDAAARAYINHPRGVAVRGGRVQLSSIFKWYGGDFGGSDQAKLRFIRRYASPALRARLKRISYISGYDYDWSLNDAVRHH